MGRLSGEKRDLGWWWWWRGWRGPSLEQHVDLAVDAGRFSHALDRRQVHEGAHGPLHLLLGGHGSQLVIVSCDDSALDTCSDISAGISQLGSIRQFSSFNILRDAAFRGQYQSDCRGGQEPSSSGFAA